MQLALIHLLLMNKKMSSKVHILIDADVIIHLFHSEKISLLSALYKGRIKMLDIVLDELRSNRTINASLHTIFLFSGIEELVFPTTSNAAMFQEYIRLKNEIKGKGERATLLYCKYNQHIIASSNTKDIVPFCQKNTMEYLTTLDIFCVAENRGIITKKEANDYIKLIFDKGSYVCCKTIEEHISKHFDSKKLSY